MLHIVGFVSNYHHLNPFLSFYTFTPLPHSEDLINCSPSSFQTPSLSYWFPSSYLLLRYTTVFYACSPSSVGPLSLSFALHPYNAPPHPHKNHRPYLIDLPPLSLLKFVLFVPRPPTHRFMNQPTKEVTEGGDLCLRASRRPSFYWPFLRFTV